MGFENTMGGGLTSVVQNYFDKGVQTSISPNADVIAVGLACPNDTKIPYSMGPLSQQCPKAPGENRRLESHCNSGQIKPWHFWHLLIYTKT